MGIDWRNYRRHNGSWWLINCRGVWLLMHDYVATDNHSFYFSRQRDNPFGKKVQRHKIDRKSFNPNFAAITISGGCPGRTFFEDGKREYNLT